MFPPTLNVSIAVPLVTLRVPPSTSTSPATVSVGAAGELAFKRNSRVPPPVDWIVRVPLTVVSVPSCAQEPPRAATLILRWPQETGFGSATGPAPPFAHFWISTVLVAP